MPKRRNSPWSSLVTILLLVVWTDTSRGQSSNLPSLAQIKAAAENGDADAQTKLGASYSMSGNPDEAAKWYRRAAEQRNTDAQLRLGHYLLTGKPHMAKDKKIVAESTKEGVRWLTKAATQGHATAQCELGQCYEGGVGVKMDKLEAYKWYRLASKKGTLFAESGLNRLILNLTSQEIAEGEKRASNFVIGQAPSDEPRKQAILSELSLKGIAGPEQHRVALINNKRFGIDDETALNLYGETVKVRCIEIHERSVVISVVGVADRYELSLH